MNKVVLAYILAAIGLGLAAGGLLFIKTIDDSQGMLGALPYICFGLGCVTFGHGVGEIIVRSAMNYNPAAAKQLEIDKKDERTLAVVNRAKVKAYDMMIFAFGALLLSFSLMGVDLIVLLLLVFAYMCTLAYNSYYRFKYFKEM